MAAANDKRVDAAQELELALKRIDVLNERMAISNEKHAKKLREQIDEEKKFVALKKEQLALDEKRLERNEKARQKAAQRRELEKEVKDNIEDQLNTVSKLDIATRAQLEMKGKANRVDAALTAKIVELENNKLKLTGEDLKKNNQMLELFKQQRDANLESVSERAKDTFKNSQALLKRIEFEKKIKDFGEEEKKIARDTYEYEEKQLKVHERLHKIQEGFNELYQELPPEASGLVDTAKKFALAIKSASMYVIPFLLLGTAAEYFVEMDKAAEQFRKDTGFTRDQMHDIQETVHHIDLEFQKFGIDAAKAFDTVNELKNTFSDISANIDQNIVAGIAGMSAALDLTSKEAANIQGVFQQVGGLSAATAVNVGYQVTEMAKLAGVSPKEVFQEIEKSAEATSKFFHGDITLLAKQAIEARRLGTTLESLSKTAEQLLDFESNIDKELTAATFVGGQFNLNRARALAMEGKLAEAHEETLKQIQRSGDFTKQSYHTQKALADAANMTVEEINKEIAVRKALSNLSGKAKENALEAQKMGLDLSKISEKDLKHKTEEFLEQNKINGQLTEMSNTFKQMTANVGQVFLPVIQAIATTFKFLADHTGIIKVGLAAVGAYMLYSSVMAQQTLAATAGRAALEEAILAAKAQQLGLDAAAITKAGTLAAVEGQGAVARIFGSIVGALGPVGLAIAAIAVGSLWAAMSSAGSKVQAHDFELESGDGSPTLMAKGKLYEFDKEDDIIAKPGLSSALSSGGGGGNNNALIAAMTRVERAIQSQNTNLYVDGNKLNDAMAYTVAQKTQRNFFTLGA